MKKSKKPTFCLIIFWLLVHIPAANAQSMRDLKREQHVDLALTAGSSMGVAAPSYVHDWYFGKRKRLSVGTGARLTLLTGKNNTFITSGPARLTRSFTTPFLIFFAGQRTANWDTLTVHRSFIAAVNVTINLGYQFTPKLFGGFNIDAIGASLGKSAEGRFRSSGKEENRVKGYPTAFNLLLTGDHDIGTLNSEFFLRYRFNKRLAARVIYQFLFAEYTTPHSRQTAYDGTIINRFRNKANNIGIGVSCYF